MVSPHDALFKFTFGTPEHAGSLLRVLLPTVLVHAIDWDSLVLVSGSEVDRDLAQHHADLLYTCMLAGRRVWLHILFEHRSHDQGCLPLDLLRYQTRIWEHEMRTEGRLTPIIPVVVHHGDHGWHAPTDLAHLFAPGLDAAGLPADLRAAIASFVPDFRFVLDDLTQVPPEALRTRAASALARLTLLCLQRIRDAEDPDAELARLADVVREVRSAPAGHDALFAVLRYVGFVAQTTPQRMQRALRQAGPETQETIMTLAETLLAEGRAEGRVHTLRQQLEARFGPLPAGALERLTRGTADDLDRWTRLVLTAPTLDEALA